MSKIKLNLNTVYDVESPPMTGCPYCGSDSFYVKIRYSGTGIYRWGFNGKEDFNSDMYDGLKTTSIGKFAYCGECGKRLFKYRP